MTSGILTSPGIKAPGDYIEDVMISVKAKNPAEPEFHQAVREVFDSLRLVLAKHPEYQSNRILDRIVEPERVLMFRVPWTDDQGNVRSDRGFPGEMNSAIGFKGGLRYILREPRHSQVSGFRTGIQEFADYASHGRRQGRIGF